MNGRRAAQLIQQTEQGIDTIAASPDLAAVKTAPASAMRLQAALEPIKGSYDLIVIDTPPTMGELTFNALQASTGLVIPLEADTNSLQGFYQITDIAQQMQRKNPALSITGVILTRFDPRPKINRRIQAAIMERAQEMGVPYLTEIRNGVAVREAAAMQLSLYEYAPRSCRKNRRASRC